MSALRLCPALLSQMPYASSRRARATGQEVYVVKADADVLGKSASAIQEPAAPCVCGPSAEKADGRPQTVGAAASTGCC
ncbi:hypothetical protein OG339_16705 [Streptosporangium sp. NBC_01495]|uniref:hypothetical protein n=1 Tax=Streptosporangium sp. NBC_01495 TaxID=2903899 RepID=UPI002E30DB64|nr:hypothetical protein [Streptosporangium sp. NBC_01495]